MVHTHSTYATAWAARGEPIPCVLTMMADEFGGEIPVGPFALIGDDSIGRGIVETLRGQPLAGGADAEPRRRSPSARDARAAVKAAVMSRTSPAPCTSPASSATRARSRRATSTALLRPLPERLRPASRRRSNAMTQPVRTRRGLVPHRQPGPVRRGDAAPGRRPVAGGSPRRSTAPTTIPVPRRRGSRCSPTADAIRRTLLEANADDRCVGVIAWMHTFSPAKMWIAGLDALRKPLLHLHTQANVDAAVGDDRHGLHEPQPGRARRPRVRLHPDPARASPARPSPGTSATRRVAAAVGAWVARRRGLRRRCATLRLARFGDNMRDVAVTEGDKVEAELRFGVSVNTYGVNDLVARGRRGRRRRRRRAGRRVRRRLRRRARAARRAASGTSRCATRARIEVGPARVPRSTAASARSPPTSRTSAACASCPASPCSG